MKKYTVTCHSITGKHGQILTKGKSYHESQFVHLKEHLDNKHIEETKEVPQAEEAKKEEVKTGKGAA